MREPIRVARISLNRTEPDRIRGGSIDLPLPDTPVRGNGVEIAGWALLEKSRGGRVHFVVEGDVRASGDLDVHRPDVVRHFNGDLAAEFCGFREWVPVAPAEREISVEIVRDDELRIPLGVITLDSNSQPIAPSPGPLGALILMYHRIGGPGPDPWSLAVDPAHFAEQMEILRRDFTAVPLSRVTSAVLPNRSPADLVAVTFDDGYADNFSTARPILERFEIPATVFLATGAIGRESEFWWDELERIFLNPGKLPDSLSLSLGGERVEANLGPAASYRAEDARRDRSWIVGRRPPGARQRLYKRLWERLYDLDDRERGGAIESLRRWSGIEETARASHRTLQAEDVRSLAVEGLIDIGAHTVTHPALSRLPVEAQKSEIESSASILEELLGRRPRSFAYPYGDLNEETPKLLQAAGFREAVTTAGIPVDPTSDPLRLSRIQVGDWDGDELAGRLNQLSIGI